MRIVKRAEFLALPAETLFCKFTPNIFHDLRIKGETLENDFYYQNIKDAVDCIYSNAMHEILDDGVYVAARFGLDFNSQFRDGLFEGDDVLFAVWETADVVQLIKRLQVIVE
ncbi:MAG: hypothetical protein GY832_03810 [Chloroflexi bacterium]|nr:hypothetical protein [Chloroflexota bacterium]